MEVSRGGNGSFGVQIRLYIEEMKGVEVCECGNGKKSSSDTSDRR